MKALKHLNKYLYKYRWRLALGILFILISKIFAIFPPQIIRHTIDLVAENIKTYHLFNNPGFESFGLEQKKVIGKIALLAGGAIIVFSLINGFFLFLTRQTIIVMSRLIEFDLKNEVYNHYQLLDLSFYKQNNTGDLMNRISEDVSRVRMYLGPAIMYSINLIILFVLVISTMIGVNAQLTLYVLLPLPILAITIYKVSNLINKKSDRVQKQLSGLSTFIQEAFSGIRVIKAYNRHEDFLDQFTNECEDYKELNLDLVKVNALFHPIMILLIGISTILTIFIGGMLTMEGKVSTGNIAEFVIYVNMLTWPIAAVGWVTSLTQRAAASQERINEFLRTKPQITNPTTDQFNFNGDIEFKNVHFTYPDSGTQALKDVSFKVPKGKSLAIMGKTGSGKSTIANLIERLYDCTNGDIKIDNHSIKEVNLSELRSEIGYVPQEVFLFSDTIANNISFGIKEHQNLTERIEQAAKDAYVYDNIVNFPEKFETFVGERGITLSGGQKQRISIARAIIKEPKILIFDDCLSAVDTETEEQILKRMKSIMKDKTTIIITHRISAAKFADNIILLDNGKIIEQGDHQNLIDQQGIYFDLFKKQQL